MTIETEPFLLHCVRCNQDKPPGDFPFSKRNNSGRSSYCRVCFNEYRREKNASKKVRQEALRATKTSSPVPEFQVETEIPSQGNVELLESNSEVLTPPIENVSFAPLPWQTKFLASKARFRVVCAGRRSGKCVKKGTLVKTPTGSTPIEQLKPGDVIYGYNLDGTISPSRVVQLHDQGFQDVIDLRHSNRIIVSCTKRHRFLTFTPRRNPNPPKYQVERVEELLEHCAKNHRLLAEFYVPIPGGTKTISEAYALGALLGDGCSTENGLKISSADPEVVHGVAESLGCSFIKKISPNNYTWQLNRNFKYKGLKDEIPYYREWLHNRYAHEKICNLVTIRTWNRKSQLEFIAGLIDTDGSVYRTQDGRLVLQLDMQAKTVIDTVEALLLDLFQTPVNRYIDNRERLVNGPVYSLVIANNKFSKRILRELPTRVPRKQWQPEYKDLRERNSSQQYVGIKPTNEYQAQCYDITVDNDSNLYLLANGIVTHNTFACLQEATRFCAEHKNANVWWVAPTFNQGAEAFRVFCKLYPVTSEIRQRLISKVHTSPPPQTVEFRSGSVLSFRSADKPDSLIGVGLHLLILDEVAIQKEEVWTLALRPTLTDYRGRAIFISTPRGKNWFYYLWLRGQPENRVDFSDWESFHATSYENLSFEDVRKEIEDTKREYGEASDHFKQEYLADFLDDSTSVFRDLDENLLGTFHRLVKQGETWTLHEKDTYGKEFPNAVSPNGEYTIGLDYAVVRDWTVIIVTRYVKAHDGLEKRVVYLERFQAPAPIVAQRCAIVHQRYNRARVVVDATGKGDALVLELQKCIPTYLITPFTISKTSKPQLIQRLQNDLAQKRVTFPNIPVLLNELNAYRAEYNPLTQHVSYSAPSHEHDDCVISLALACSPPKVKPIQQLTVSQARQLKRWL